MKSPRRGDLAQRLAGLYVIADDLPGHRHDVRRVVETVCKLAAEIDLHVLQLRIKHLRDGDALALADWVVARAHAADVSVIVNDRFDLACASGADGVHLGADDLPVERIPSDLRERLIVGLSTHTLDQVRASSQRGVDYIGFGPIFATGSKESEYSPRGPEMLERAVALAQVPVVAIGGIDASRIRDVKRCGATAAAVISAVSEAGDPAMALVELARAQAGPRPGTC